MVVHVRNEIVRKILIDRSNDTLIIILINCFDSEFGRNVFIIIQ